MKAVHTTNQDLEAKELLRKGREVDQIFSFQLRALALREAMPKPELPPQNSPDAVLAPFLLVPIDGRKVFVRLLNFLESRGYNFNKDGPFAIEVGRPKLLDAHYYPSVDPALAELRSSSDAARQAREELKRFGNGNLIVRKCGTTDAESILLECTGITSSSTLITIERRNNSPFELQRFAHSIGWDGTGYQDPREFWQD